MTDTVGGTTPINAVPYGAEWAARWEEDFGTRPDTEAAVEAVVELAAGRAVLELGVGTGRLALPLARRGLEVHGVDDSPWMLDGLRAKPDSELVTLTQGDMVDTVLDRRFGVVLLAGGLFALTTQERQTACFAAAARHLTPGGHFVVDVRSPQLLRQDICRAISITAEQVVLLVSTAADPVTQRLQTAYVHLRADEVTKILPWDSRCVGGPEMDLMARLAGLSLQERWGGWNGEPYTPVSGKHISIYERSATSEADQESTS